MKILHLPTEVAGQASITVKALRELGHDAHNLAYPHPFGYDLDIPLQCHSNKLIRGFNKLQHFINIAEKFEVYHYHYGDTLFPKMMDAKYLKFRNKRIIGEFWGSEIRIPSVEFARNPFLGNDLNSSDDGSMRKLELWSKLTEGEVVFADQSFNINLEKYFDKIHIVGQRINIAQYTPEYPKPEKRKVRIVHAPSVLAIKGTKYIEKAIENLKKKKLDIEYIRVHGVSHTEATEIYRSADIIIDQLCLGSHGVFACEAMALGKPTICYILPEFMPGYPDGFPIINANPLTIESVLEEWIELPERLYHQGIKSREYAEEVHDSRKVASNLLRIYRKNFSFESSKYIDWRKDCYAKVGL